MAGSLTLCEGAEHHVPSVPETRGINCSGLVYELYSSATKAFLREQKRQAGPLELNVTLGRLTFLTAVLRQKMKRYGMCHLALHLRLGDMK